jgi:hypothetical protein
VIDDIVRGSSYNVTQWALKTRHVAVPALIDVKEGRKKAKESHKTALMLRSISWGQLEGLTVPWALTPGFYAETRNEP